MQMILQGGNRRLEQVNQRGQARKQDCQEEDNHDNLTTRHGCKQVGQINEHQTRAAAKCGASGRSHRRNDDQCGEHSCQCVKQRNLPRRADDIFLVGQVRAIDNGTVTRQRQREERLSECVNPHFGLLEHLGINSEHPAIAVGRTVLEAHIDHQSDKQRIEQRNHDLVGTLDAAGDAQCHDDKGHDQRDDQPHIVTEGCGRLTECLFIARHVAHVRAIGQCRAGERTEQVLENPADNDRIADRERQCAHHRQHADRRAHALFAARCARLLECTDRAGACRTAKAHLADDTRKTDHNVKNQIRDQKRAAVLGNTAGKQPDISHTDCRADTCQDKTPF